MEELIDKYIEQWSKATVTGIEITSYHPTFGKSSCGRMVTEDVPNGLIYCFIEELKKLKEEAKGGKEKG